MVGSKANGKCR